MEGLGPAADFIVINVSSPNTPGLRNWQSPEKMTELFAAMLGKTGESPRPVLVKISPDLERNELFRICETALELGVDGIVACNTTILREAIGVSSPHPGGAERPPADDSRARVDSRHPYAHPRKNPDHRRRRNRHAPRMRGCTSAPARRWSSFTRRSSTKGRP